MSGASFGQLMPAQQGPNGHMNILAKLLQQSAHQMGGRLVVIDDQNPQARQRLAAGVGLQRRFKRGGDSGQGQTDDELSRAPACSLAKRHGSYRRAIRRAS